MARTQKNKATSGHLGMLKAKLAKLRRDLLEPKGGGGAKGEGWNMFVCFIYWQFFFFVFFFFFKKWCYRWHIHRKIKVLVGILECWKPNLLNSEGTNWNWQVVVDLKGKVTACLRSGTGVNPLSTNIAKWSNTLKQFVSTLPTNCLSVFDNFVGLVLKALGSGISVLFQNSR